MELFCSGWIHVALSATFTAVWVVRSTWNGPSHLSLSTLSPQISYYHEISWFDVMQGSFSNFPLSSFHLHTDIRQQRRHFFAVTQHVMLTQFCRWQLLFTSFYSHKWWFTKENFEWAQVYPRSFSHSHVHEDARERFNPCESSFLTTLSSVTAVCSQIYSQKFTHLFDCLINKMCPIVRAYFSVGSPTSGLSQSAEPLLLLLRPVLMLGMPRPIWTTCPPTPNNISFPHMGTAR